MSTYKDKRNPYGYCAPGYWEFEAKKNGFKTAKDYLEHLKATAPRCPSCGTPQGFAWGTGDCGCEGDY
jgi:hypothetical protein